MSDADHAEARVVITHAVGLHARPSVKFTKLAKGFAARIELATAPSGPWVDAKSIVRVMATRAPTGSELFLRAEGSDAPAAIAALAGLVQRNFDEGGHV
ncbi:MAG: HPr family phosphocarrier protein [Devosia sp.]|nr:HPr family phosphocarrier protein [Devosia sp.]